jgi:D-sedoheptulose 7-phosphate isomerase
MNKFIENLINRYGVLQPIADALNAAAEAWINCALTGGKILTAGNGGSACDAEHITGELLKGFMKKRPLPPEEVQKFTGQNKPGAAELASSLQMGIAAVNLGNAQALVSAFGNDVNPQAAFAQHLWALARPGDVFVGISTGGNAENIRLALIAARAAGVRSILLTGNKNGVCCEYADIVVAVPEKETFLIQELHLPIYHALCQAVEAALFNE